MRPCCLPNAHASLLITQAEELNWANFTITAAVAAMSVPLIWLFVQPLGMGATGAAWASSISTSSYLLLQIPHLICTGRGYLFRPIAPSRVLDRAGMSAYLRLMAPGFVMQVLEWWMQELVVVLAGLLRRPDVTIGAVTLSMAFQGLGVMAWIGLAVASSTLVGQHIGANEPCEARAAACVAVGVGLLLSACFGGALVVWAAPLAVLCTNDPAIRHFTAWLLPIVGSIELADATSNALGGVCSGLGLQRYAAWAQLGGYAVGMAVGAGLAFGWRHGAEDGAMLLWAGLGISMLFAVSLQLAFLCRHDWERSAMEASDRLTADRHSAACAEPGGGGLGGGGGGVGAACVGGLACEERPATADRAAAGSRLSMPLLDEGTLGVVDAPAACAHVINGEWRHVAVPPR